MICIYLQILYIASNVKLHANPYGTSYFKGGINIEFLTDVLVAIYSFSTVIACLNKDFNVENSFVFKSKFLYTNDFE